MIVREISFRFVAVIAVMASSAVFASAALVSHWQFEDNLSDAAGPNSGTGSGPLGYESAVVGRGLNLNGGHVSVANPIAGGLESASGFTVALFVNFETVVGGGSLVNLRTTANMSGFTLEERFAVPGSISFFLNTVGGAAYDEIFSSGWQTGQFYHLAVSYDAASKQMKMYRDGVQVASGLSTNSGMVTNAGHQFQIGRNVVNGTLSNSTLDDVRFYNSALTDQEIAALAVPEPMTMLGLAAGAAILARRKRKA